MSERFDEAARSDLDAVRETDEDQQGDEAAKAAKEEFEDDPSRNPDDENLKDYKGG